MPDLITWSPRVFVRRLGIDDRLLLLEVVDVRAVSDAVAGVHVDGM
jgi:hypothetical protein